MTYDYKCTNCDKLWEEEQKITDPKIVKCPHCGNDTAMRLISGSSSFILKNGGCCGWASNGYK